MSKKREQGMSVLVLNILSEYNDGVLELQKFIREMQNMHILKDGWRERHLILKALLLVY